MVDARFGDFAKKATGSPGAFDKIGAAMIEANGLLHEEQAKTAASLSNLDTRIGSLETQVIALTSTLERFNKDSGKLYKTLNALTGVIALATVVQVVLSCIRH